MSKPIPLGFEVGTGEPVRIPLDHLIITGRTRASGKTTTLEAIVQRSGLRALTFLTKPGEDTFQSARFIRPYFHDEGGWRFVASILEATLGEKLKLHRSEIINACRGTHSLREVRDRIIAKKEKARGLILSLLTELEAYFEIVLPQIERTPFAKTLELGPGANVIDMSSHDYSDELQSLVIRSALGWVLKHEKGVLTVIPEAWKFIPEERGNPVKEGCATLIRQGGVHQNWVAIDSQEVTSVDAGIRKSCGTWILGVQRELNEVKRVIDQLPGKPKPTVEEVMTLGLGHFFVSYTGATTRKVYVQPAWMEEEMARSVAKGEIDPWLARSVHGKPEMKEPEPKVELTIPVQRNPADSGPVEEEKESESEEEEMATEEVKELHRKLDRLLERMPPVMEPTAAATHAGNPAPHHSTGFDEETLFQRFKARLLKEPAVLKVMATQPEIAVEVERRTIAMDGTSLKGRIAKMIAEGFFSDPRTASETRRELKRTGGDSPETNIARVFAEYLGMGFLTRDGKAYQAVPGMKVNIVKRQAAAS